MARERKWVASAGKVGLSCCPADLYQVVTSSAETVWSCGFVVLLWFCVVAAEVMWLLFAQRGALVIVKVDITIKG